MTLRGESGSHPEPQFPPEPAETPDVGGVEAVLAAFDAAVAETATWCGPFGYPGVAGYIDRRDQFIRERLAALRADQGDALARAWDEAHQLACQFASNCWGGGCPAHENPYRADAGGTTETPDAPRLKQVRYDDGSWSREVAPTPSAAPAATGGGEGDE